MDAKDKAQLLSQLFLFKGMSQSQIVEIMEISREVHVADGDKLCTEGEAARSVFIVEQGTVRITKQSPDKTPQLIAELKAPTVIGEIALLDGSARSATARATQACYAHEINSEAFERLRTGGSIAAHQVIRNIARTLCQRLRDTNNKIDELLANPEAGLARMQAEGHS